MRCARVVAVALLAGLGGCSPKPVPDGVSTDPCLDYDVRRLRVSPYTDIQTRAELVLDDCVHKQAHDLAASPNSIEGVSKSVVQACFVEIMAADAERAINMNGMARDDVTRAQAAAVERESRKLIVQARGGSCLGRAR